MKEREKRLVEVEEILRRSLERNQGRSEALKQLITDTDFLKAVQEASVNVEAKHPEIKKLSPKEQAAHPEFRRELKRITEEKEKRQ